MIGLAGESQLLGTWKLKSYIGINDAGERSTPYGEHPSGYLSYLADGRMHAIGAAGARTAPQGSAPSSDEKLALYKSMFAYAGTYSADADKVVHHVDISWNQAWTGTDQTRFYKVTGNTLVITATTTHSAGGGETQYVITWEKVEGRH